MAYSKSARGMVQDYATLRSIPMVLAVAFLGASLYQFGGIATIELTWFGNYTLTDEHSVLVSMGAMLIAFASSETRTFAGYETWEMAVIASGPVLIVGDYMTVEVTDVILAFGDPLGYQIAFVLTAASWAVAVVK